MEGVLFDIGGVIQPVTWDKAAEVLGVPKEEYKATFLRDRERYFNRYERGEIPSAEFARFVLSGLGREDTLGNRNEFSESIRNLWGEPDLEVLGLIRKASKKYRIGILSNSCPELEERAQSFERTPRGYLRLFSPNVFLSHRIGAKKPESRAYDSAVRALGLIPSECYFIDDKPENVESAGSFGLRGILYQNPQQVALALGLVNYGPDGI